MLADIPSFSAFAQDVEDALDGDELRYSERQRLLKRAEHFGIKRFDANLIIAMVQGRHEGREANHYGAQQKGSAIPAITTVVVIQSLIFAGLWWIYQM